MCGMERQHYKGMLDGKHRNGDGSDGRPNGVYGRLLRCEREQARTVMGKYKAVNLYHEQGK